MVSRSKTALPSATAPSCVFGSTWCQSFGVVPTSRALVEPKSKERPEFTHEIANNLILRPQRRLGLYRVELILHPAGSCKESTGRC
ncbi:hypothetical protein BR93DRAFT_922742 [Coniochaeta sp. PMI_546]|nr:hypothetical protein BR93DRAFT_922742 [Coniochaeta sp. PMI_546]